jgi:hypothetical protein
MSLTVPIIPHLQRNAGLEFQRAMRYYGGMKTDLYTKIVLRVIAGCLFCMAFRDVNFVSPVRAEPNVEEEMLREPTKVNIVQIDGHGFDSQQVDSSKPTLPVSSTVPKD